MVIHHTGGLHVGIANGAAKKGKTAFFHVFADGIGNRGTCRNGAGSIVDGLAIGHKAVHVCIIRAELFLYFDKEFGIVNG